MSDHLPTIVRVRYTGGREYRLLEAGLRQNPLEVVDMAVEHVGRLQGSLEVLKLLLSSMRARGQVVCLLQHLLNV